MQDSPAGEITTNYHVDSEKAGERLDVFLSRAQTDLSRNRIKQLILSGAATINGKSVVEPKYKVKTDEKIILVTPPPEDPEPKPENIPLEIVFEDDQLIVINKPVGLVVHPAPGTPTGTLVNALLYYCGASFAGIGGVKRPGIVHRLDKDTSGIMVVAKTEIALNHLANQFADHGRTGPLKRAYIAFSWGHMQTHAGRVDAPLGRDKFNRFKQSVRPDGRNAITHYKTLARFGGDGWEVTKLECQLETGRTHQIRVHMAHIGHPLIADPLYATGYATKSNRLPDIPRNCISSLGRQALHAAKLGFKHPTTGETMLFEADLPKDLIALQSTLEPFDQAFKS